VKRQFGEVYIDRPGLGFRQDGNRVTRPYAAEREDLSKAVYPFAFYAFA